MFIQLSGKFILDLLVLVESTEGATCWGEGRRVECCHSGLVEGFQRVNYEWDWDL